MLNEADDILAIVTDFKRFVTQKLLGVLCQNRVTRAIIGTFCPETNVSLSRNLRSGDYSSEGGEEGEGEGGSEGEEEREGEGSEGEEGGSEEITWKQLIQIVDIISSLPDLLEEVDELVERKTKSKSESKSASGAKRRV
jgi:hypothetical protein